MRERSSQITAVATSTLAIAALVTMAWLFFNAFVGFGQLKSDVAHLQEDVARIEVQIEGFREDQRMLRRDLLEAIDRTAYNHSHDQSGAVIVRRGR